MAEGCREIVELLVRNGADVNIRVSGNGHGTPLHSAVAWGHQDIAQFLMQEGADATLTDEDGNTAFDIRPS